MDWANDCVNVHLIRHPARVIASYGAKRETVMLEDLGFRQQAELYDRIGGVVIDSAEIRDNPDGMLRKLCDAIGLPYDPRMLNWPEGGHRDDGIWASHWYGAVHGSSGFAGPEGALPQLQGDYASLAEAALPYYQMLFDLRLVP